MRMFLRVLIFCIGVALLYLAFTAMNIVYQRDKAINEKIDYQTAVFDYDVMNALYTTQSEQARWLNDDTDKQGMNQQNQVLIIHYQCLDKALRYNSMASKINPTILEANGLPTAIDIQSCHY